MKSSSATNNFNTLSLTPDRFPKSPKMLCVNSWRGENPGSLVNACAEQRPPVPQMPLCLWHPQIRVTLCLLNPTPRALGPPGHPSQLR